MLTLFRRFPRGGGPKRNKQASKKKQRKKEKEKEKEKEAKGKRKKEKEKKNGQKKRERRQKGNHPASLTDARLHPQSHTHKEN